MRLFYNLEKKLSELNLKNLSEMDPSFQKLLERFYGYLYAERGLSVHTLRAYLFDVQEFLLFLQREAMDIQKTDLQLVRSYFTEITGSNFHKKSPDQRSVTGRSSGRKLNPRSQARKLSSLKTFFRLLIRDDIILENPLNRISSPKFYQKLPSLIQPALMSDFFNELELKEKESEEMKKKILLVRDRALYEMLYSSGMRISEILSIRISDLKKNDSRIKILGKGNRERIVFIGEEAKKALNSYLSVREKFNPVSEFLFLNFRGMRMDPRGVRYRLSELKKKSGISERLHPHKFRHSFATDLLNSGADIRAVQEMLGHKSISSTQIYTSVSKDRLREIHRKCHPHGKNSS
ncbi:MAG: tyrosine recombinase XerC [Spirochaetia bacterium]|nr:tyrosine recombinase XerC [Spirochaetia bacterium]